MKLSVVVPVLDEAAGIGAALDALAPLRVDGHEVLVVDGGSRDATPALAAPRADRVLVAPRGRALQMNVGAHVATGDVLLFLHADARLPAGAASSIAAALAAGARWGRFDVSLAGRSPWLPVVAAFMNARSAATGIATGDQGIFVRRDAFEAAGAFPPIALMEDVALSARLARTSGPPARIRDRIAVSGRRWDRDGALRTIVTMWRLRYAYWRGEDPQRLVRRYYGRAPERAPVLQVFAKAPVPGRVKTRLGERIGGPAAAEAYARLATATLATAERARRLGLVAAVELWVEPGSPPDAFDRWRTAATFELHEQRGEDLGARMRHALRTSLARGSRALLVGTDVPGYDVPYIAEAAAALGANDAVVGPAEDGGYVLIGLRRDVDAFSGVAWSSPGVLAATRARLAAAGATWHELPPLWDVDTYDDWQRWRARADGAAEGTCAAR